MSFYWITAKELLAFFRDRRAWLANLLLPVVLLPLTMFGPLLLGGIFAGQGQSQLQTLAFVSGYLAMLAVYGILRRGNFRWFAPYVWVLAAVTLVLQLR